MAYHDTLFQLGMDLTRSSTAQEEDFAAPRGREDRGTALHGRGDGRFDMTHEIIDLLGARRLDDPKHIERALRRSVKASGARLVHVHLRRVAPNGGVSGVAVLADSHISFWSWPEANYAALDVIRGDAKPPLGLDTLKAAFGADDVRVKERGRGPTRDGRARGGEKSSRRPELVAAKAA